MDPKGYAAIVTGAASGLGAETAATRARAGATVACLDVNLDGANATASSIGGVAIRCDVTSADDAASALKSAKDAHGAARILVNCAGIAIAVKTVNKDGAHSLDLYRKVIEVNLIGTFNMIRLFAVRAQDLEPLEGGERGVIINTASVAAFDGQVGQVAYSSSKGGIVGLTLPVARDLSRSGIRVCTIAPGIFKTPMMAGLPEDAQKSLGQQVPFPPRLGEPNEYAALACHIVDNQMLNGETIRLDGAIRMAPR
jgi:NAD(P)-dependent dehydrogenase (short-subunit alcohol dehydrogenase family)